MIFTDYHSDEKKNILKALVKVQSELQNLTKDTKAFKIGFPRFLFVFVVSTSFSNGAKHCIYGKQCPKYEVMF